VEVRNRFKELDLIDRVPDELWTEVHDIVQETGIKTIPMEKKCKKANWLSEEALQIAVKRREAKSKEDADGQNRVERCSTTRVIRAMPIKTIMKHHLTAVKMSITNKCTNI